MTKPIAVTGIGVVCAAGNDAESLWARIIVGDSAIGRASAPMLSDFPDAYVGEVDDRELVDRMEQEDLAASREVRLSSLAIRECLSAHGGSVGDGKRAGLVLGRCQGQVDGGPADQIWMHATADVLAGRFDLRGPRLTISTACAAGGNAIGEACDRIIAGEADIMLAGGVDLLQRGTYAGFNALRSLDRRPCAPYTRSSGLNLGEGAAFLVLETVERAVAAGRRPLATVLGYGLSADAYHATAPDPTGRGAVLAVQRALAAASIKSDDVTYVNGHGTGTPANDSTERRVMRAIFGERVREVPITGTKSFVGHTLGAAGAVEAVVTVLSIDRGAIPPTANADEAAGDDIDVVPNVARPAPIDVVVSNNYAFGGNNVSVVFGRPTAGEAAVADLPPTGEIYLSGLGLVGAPGLGVDEWVEAVSNPTGAARTTMKELLDRRNFAPANKWRHMNSFTRACMAATRLCLEDSGLTLEREAREGTGVLVATMAGPAATMLSAEELSQGDTDSVNVHQFANTVLNAPAGAVCEVLGLRGPTTTLLGGGAAAISAIATAAQVLRTGAAERIIVLGCDEQGRFFEDIQRIVGSSPDSTPIPDSSACVAVLLETEAALRERGGTAYAKLVDARQGSDTFHAFRHDPAGERFAEVVGECTARIDSSIDVVVSARNGDPDLAAAESVALDTAGATAAQQLAVKQFTGECEAASGMAAVALAALAVSGRLASSLPAGDDAPVRHALATAASFGGVYGACLIGAA